MTSPDTSTPRPDLLARDEVAQVRDDEAKARKAEADAAMSELTLTQARYKALVPDLTGVATNVVTDKSVGVAFSGLVTHSALNHAAEDIANRIATVLTGPDQGRQRVILVTSQTDLLTSDLLSTTVKDCLDQLNKFANQLLTLTEPRQLVFENERRADSGLRVQDQARDLLDHLSPLQSFLEKTSVVAAAPGGAAAAGALAVGLGPIGLATAAAAAVPSIISLFSSTTTVKDHSEDITDLTTTTSVLAAVADKLGEYKLVHEDFRLAPAKSQIRKAYRRLADRRARLICRQLEIQAIENGNVPWLSGAEPEWGQLKAQQTARVETDPQAGADGSTQATDEDEVVEAEIARYSTQQPEPEVEADPARSLERDQRVADLAEIRERAEAGIDSPVVQIVRVNIGDLLSVISGAITSIDAFTTAVNATAAGARSPLAIASLNELLHIGGADGIGYVLSVKGLGGQSREYTKDRHVGFDTYTTLADASVSFMLYDVAGRKIIKSGIANGVSSVHGRLGKPPKELAANQSGQPSEPRKAWWRPWSWARPHARLAAAPRRH